MSERWLKVIGIGDDGCAGLSPAARALVDAADIVVGGERHLAFLSDGRAERHPWTSPLSDMVERLKDWQGRSVVVLATGDPMWFGIGATLRRVFSADDMLIVPSPSAFSLAASRLGWSLDQCETMTLHGRPLDLLNARLYPGARILALTADETTPKAVADRLVELGYGDARLTVLDHMGGDREEVQTSAASAFAFDVTPFNTLAIQCPADAPFHSRCPGLPDEAFSHDGKMTKQEVRAATLARLKPYPGACLWDVGAGCGSIAIEWMRAAHRASAIAIEPLEKRRAMILENAATLGAPGLEVVTGRAPEALDGLKQPDAVFIGGGLSFETVELCQDRLRPGGVLVANAVTLESETVLLECFNRFGGELSRIAVSRAEPVGPFHGWRPFMPVTQWQLTKPHVNRS
ncbi:precorrin-6y C5,15-methyltransferase (decarboxylating) subunit CbiE [Coralliovum pocilloporae]|uniref:precorrin-6y C5,15-methyltransferase (decarboxylating) subunit CbiE n=1 Tax=Coralliovum pocilloporae TaxID=3066369 RepID=UPI003307B894